jgi:hypothetical protein
MEVEEFQVSLSADAPQVEMSLPQQALWWAGKGNWERAHECVQQREGDPDCDLVHAYLHRLEGDLGNAAYWYRRAGHPVATDLLKAEWDALVEQMFPPA